MNTNPGGRRSAKYLGGRGPLLLVSQFEVGDRSQASRLEYLFKSLPKKRKRKLHQSSRHLAKATKTQLKKQETPKLT